MVETDCKNCKVPWGSLRWRSGTKTDLWMRSKLAPDGFWGPGEGFWGPGEGFWGPGEGFWGPGEGFWGPGTAKNAVFEGPGRSKNVSGKGVLGCQV